MKEFRLKILAADKALYDGNAISVNVPLGDGSMGILANHSSMVSAIVPGVLTYRTVKDGPLQKAAVSDGLIKVENNEVLILVDTAEKAEDIDIIRARKAAEEAKEALRKEQNRREQMTFEADLARAISRIKASQE